VGYRHSIGHNATSTVRRHGFMASERQLVSREMG
jgi:hypothetical protein